MATKLSPTMTLAQFDNGYWYARELKIFAREIGIPAATKLRKDQLETAIKHFLKTGKIAPKAQIKSRKSDKKDSDIGLHADLAIITYTNNKITKMFIAAEAEKRAPGLKPKSGARYRLNRWREAQLQSGHKITYGDLVDHYIALNKTQGSFARIPQGRYINFLADFLHNEPDATHDKAVTAWHQLKQLGAPKSYKAWKKHRK